MHIARPRKLNQKSHISEVVFGAKQPLSDHIVTIYIYTHTYKHLTPYKLLRKLGTQSIR